MYTYNKRSQFQKQLRLDVRIILCLMSSGVFVHTFALPFRKISSAIAKAGPSKDVEDMIRAWQHQSKHWSEALGDVQFQKNTRLLF